MFYIFKDSSWLFARLGKFVVFGLIKNFINSEDHFNCQSLTCRHLNIF